MLTIDALKQFGANTDEGLGRCLSNEAFYLRLIGKALEDKNMAKLGECLAAGDGEGAFEAAHAMKGVMANLALTPVLVPVSEISDGLKEDNKVIKDPEKLQQLYQEAKTQFDKLLEMTK